MKDALLTFPSAFLSCQNCTGWSVSDLGRTGFSRSMHQSIACFYMNVSPLGTPSVTSDQYLMLHQIDSEISSIDTRRVGVFGKCKHVVRG